MKRNIIFTLLTLILTALPTIRMSAVESNPELALQITMNKQQMEKALKAEKLAQALMSEGHVFVGREVQATSEFQREFNKYLDSFQGTVAIAAQLFGIYYEMKRTTKIVSQVSSTLASAPANAIAVGFKPRGSGLYTSIINTSLSAAQDLYNACIAKQKMTEEERRRILTDCRTKIKRVNSDLNKLLVLLKYTTFEDIWFGIRERAYFLSAERKNAVIERCYRNWKHNIR